MMNIKEKLIKNTVWACLILFIILLIVHSAEAIFIRMDETFFGENFINKLFGILVLYLVLNFLDGNGLILDLKKKTYLKI